MTRLHTPLIKRIKEVLEEDDRVLAAWLEGSIARNEDDDLSDVDLWISVKDNAFDDFIETREQFATQLGPVTSLLYPKEEHGEEPIESFHIILEEMPTAVSVDIHVQPRSRHFTFTKGSDAEECKVLFDKAHIVKIKQKRPEVIERQAVEAFDEVSLRFWHLIPKVAALIERGDLLEASEQYRRRLEEYITLLRIVHSPEKVDWGLKDIEYDLPEDVVKIIYQLMPTLSAKTLHKQLAKLLRLFLKQQKMMARTMKHQLPEALIKQVMREL